MRKIIVGLVLALFLLNPSAAHAFDKYGVTVGESISNSSTIGTEDDCHDVSWDSVGVFGRINLIPTWYADIELAVGQLIWDEEEVGETLLIESRAMFMKDYKYVHVGLGFGLAYPTDNDNTYHLKNGTVLGLLTGRLRVPISTYFGLDFEADHVSAIAKDDSGVNVWKTKLYFVF